MGLHCLEYGINILRWLAGNWHPDSNSPGWLVVFVSIGLIWLKRAEFKQAKKSRDRRGLLVVAASIIAYFVGCRLQHPIPGVFGLIGLAWAIPFCFWGGRVAELLFFPCIYLAFAIPNLLAGLTCPMRMFSSTTSVVIANGLGIEALRQGTIIGLPGTEVALFDIADECNGIRSFLALTALAAAYASLTQKDLWRKWLLFLSAIPLAVTGNIARCVSIIIAASLFGRDIAIDGFHVYAPRVIFVINVLLMASFGEWLKKRQHHR